MSKFSFSLTRLVENLLTPESSEKYIPIPGEEIKATTIRPDPEVKKFCEVQAEKMGISFQAFINIVLKGVMLETLSPQKSEITLMQERFFEIFKSHNIPVSHIPILLRDYNISLSILADNNRLLDHYSDKLIEHLSQRFHLSKDWLNGTRNLPSCHKDYWYKWSASLCRNLMEKKKSKINPTIYLFYDNKNSLDNLAEHQGSNREFTITLVVQEQVHYDDNQKSYCSYETYRCESWRYEPCRIELKCIILYCYLIGVDVNFSGVSTNTLEEINSSSTYFAKVFPTPPQNSRYAEDLIDGYEEDIPFRTSKPQGELFNVFSLFLKKGFHESIKQDLKDLPRLPFFNVKKVRYLDKISKLQELSEKSEGLDYSTIQRLNNELSEKMISVHNNETIEA